ncbi:MAG: Uncharacterized protein G01um10145_740 [Microgenomates group bacterium Gr01-1014_5]|nr:MAG: Uncharacterized protein G01um10145_740 [Microgenomates group bacterium Gr01-1014_5]
MGYYGRLEEKLKAQKLRKQGLSYGEIMLQLPVSKSSLSDWCKEIPLTKKQELRLLRLKSLGQRKGSIIAAQNKRRFRICRTKEIFKMAKQELGRISYRDKFIAGIALYSGEGNKTDGQGGFANSDPKLINFMMKWFQRYCNIPMSKFRGSIWLHEGLNEKQSKQYWSDLTGIPINQFYKTYIAKNKIGSRKIRKNIHKFGVFSINFLDSQQQRRIIGLISGVVR